jgi:hypothetical protein
MNSRQSELAGMGKDRGIRYYMVERFLNHFELPVGAELERYAVRDEITNCSEVLTKILKNVHRASKVCIHSNSNRSTTSSIDCSASKDAPHHQARGDVICR